MKRNNAPEPSRTMSPFPRALLATATPEPQDRRFALCAILASAVCFVLASPFARIPLSPVPAFIPAYESALAISDLITAILLFGQFTRLRRLSLLILGSGYLFNAALIVAHALSFPGVFSAGGLLGAGPQTTAWLYIFWHAGFPLFVLAYVLLANFDRDVLPERIGTGTAIAISFAVILGLAVLVTLTSTVGHNLLPEVVVDGDYSRLVSFGISPGILALTAIVIGVMWSRRTATVLDVWLFAVLWVWLCDIALSAVVGSARFDLGWYAGRLFGLLAASFVLGALLMELNKLYGRLADSIAHAEAQNKELIASRSELARAQRFEAIGQLTGGIAHDFNNILTAILGSLELISRRPDETERVSRFVTNAAKAADRGAQLVRQLLTFARKQNLKPEVLNPNSVLMEFENFAARAAGEAITAGLKLDQAVFPVHVDATEFQAAMLNLISNARDAMPNGGSLTIESRNVHLDESYVRGHPDASAGNYVMIAVSDTGVGMNQETKLHAFDPFFTTKPVGEGTGLGLSQVYGFSKSAGGHAEVYSEVGVGTTIKLYIPRSFAGPSSHSPLDTVLLRPAQAGETVLLVEDDPDLIHVTEESLRELGYEVLTSTTAEEALQILKRGERVDILFSDVVMPGGMNGVQLVVNARRVRPELKVLLTSGYTGAALQQHGIPADLPLLSKPYHREELAHKLRIVLASE